MAGSQDEVGDAYEVIDAYLLYNGLSPNAFHLQHFVQQMMALPAKAFNISLQVEVWRFLCASFCSC